MDERISGDRVSDLPDELLHHIFSFLPFKSIVQTSVLSKHWNHLSLWRSHPHLDFSCLLSKSTELIPTVLSRRQPDSNIATFRLSGIVSSSCLRKCIDRIMNQGIEQLELDVDANCVVNLPRSLFNCNTLRVLKLNNQTDLVVGVLLLDRDSRFPAPGLVPALHTLCLTNTLWLEVSSDVFSGSNFPLLRKLCLKKCVGLTDLNINCPGLEILELDVLRLKGLEISGTGLLELQVTECVRCPGSWAKILAPNLRRLYWKDNFNVKCVTQSFENLNTGSVHFCSVPLLSRNPATLQGEAAFISALCFARSLSASDRVLMILSSMDSKGGLPFCFNNLTTLEIHTHLTKYGTKGIICLLRSSPVLHTINIRVDCSKLRNESWDDDRYWRSQSQNVKSIERHLKAVKIDIVGGTKMPKSAFHLVKFLLRYGTTLQEMTLTLKVDPTDPHCIQQRIRSEIMKLACPCTNVTISFLSQDQHPLIAEELY